MDLENAAGFAQIDPDNMYGHIHDLPGQLEAAWKMGAALPLPARGGLRAIIITGMGGSAIGADLAATYASRCAEIPVWVVREYDLPAWVRGGDVLVVASSHSGNTEETLSAFQQARERGCQVMTLSTGGKLKQIADEIGVPAWTFEHIGQPRAAVGFSFGLIVSILSRLGVIPDVDGEISRSVAAMRIQQSYLGKDVPVHSNPAKRLAGQLYGRWVTVLGSDLMAPVARRCKGQINEIAKAWAQFELLPEADHNTLTGIFNPAELLARMEVLFLKAPSDHPRNQLRRDLTRRSMMVEGLATDTIEASGDCPMAHIWTALHFGDYMAYYLSMLYEVDPTPITIMNELKKALSSV